MRESRMILIFGDICPDNDYRKRFDANASAVFSSELVADIEKAALVVGNLECPATDFSEPIAKCGPSLRACPSDVQKLRDVGFDVLSLANNHILDYGEKGFEDTLRLCYYAGIQTVGAGKSESEACAPAICNVGDKKVGIVSYAEAEFNLVNSKRLGANIFDPYESYDIICELKSACDYVIVLYHGGIEHYKNPSPLLQKRCRKFIRSGADLVLCQHSHCIGTVERVDDGVILYGQGNSVFGYREGNDAWNEGLLVAVDLAESYNVAFRLLKATPKGIRFASDSEGRNRVQQMEADSKNISDPMWIQERWRQYTQKQRSLDMPLLYGWNQVFIKLNRILSNRLVDLCYSKKKQRITMNLLRCEAHREVVQTILEEKVFAER